LKSLNYTLRSDNKNYVLGMPKSGKKIPVLLFAHLDTKQKEDEAPKHILFDPDYRVMWTPETLGADDRAGVYAVLKLIEQRNCSVLFTTGEERGGLGAKEFVKHYSRNKWGFRAGIQLDRRGKEDAVFYKNRAEDFQEWVTGFGFTKTTGSFTDISVVGPAWKMNTVNLSVGYYNEHLASEYLMLDPLEDTIDKVDTILSKKIPVFKYKEEETVVRSYAGDDKWGATRWDNRKWNYETRKYDYGVWSNIEQKYVFDGDESEYIYDSSRYPSYGTSVYRQESFADSDHTKSAIITPPPGRIMAIECVMCSYVVNEIEAIAIGVDDNPESVTYGVDLFLCDSCFDENDGFFCTECGKAVLPTLHSDYMSAVEAHACDDCFVKVLGARDADEWERGYRESLGVDEDYVINY